MGPPRSGAVSGDRGDRAAGAERIDQPRGGRPAYVSSDHRRAYYEITRSRIAAYPEALPVLLQSRPDSLVTGYRCEGFVDACRETGKFYEVVRMPPDFKEKVATLEERLKLSDERPLLVVSDTRAHTGALMRWSAFHPVEWRGNLFYSDFDNDFDTDIFGVRVTGFLQDQELLFKEAAAKLKRNARRYAGRRIGTAGLSRIPGMRIT